MNCIVQLFAHCMIPIVDSMDGVGGIIWTVNYCTVVFIKQLLYQGMKPLLALYGLLSTLWLYNGIYGAMFACII